MNSENLRFLRKNSKFANKSQISLKSLENLMLLTMEGFGDLPSQPFSEEWVKDVRRRQKLTTDFFQTF